MREILITEHCIQTSYKRCRYPFWAIILIITYMKIWYHEAVILLIKPSCLQRYIPKIFHVYKKLLSNKAKLHKNEHFIQQWSVFGLFARTFNFWISFLLQVCDTFMSLTNLFLIIVPSMLKADLSNFQRLSSLFYLMFWILIKQL